MSVTPETLFEAVQAEIAKYPTRRGAVLPALHLTQEAYGWLSPEALEACSDAIGSDGMGNSLDHIRHIMGESMEALIHHFKLVTEGFTVPAGQVYTAVESPRGELGAHVVSDGGNKPYRVHFRDPSFTNLQATSVMSEGGMVADVIVAIASIDPVMGGVDR